MLKHFVMSLMVLGLIFGSTSLVTAANIPINSVDGDWVNWVGGQNVTASNSTNPSTIQWGDSGGYSSYAFLSAVPPAFNALSDGTPFSLGVFTHNNYPITSGTSITQVDLAFSLGIDGLSPFTATFLFQHNETPNSCQGLNCSNDIVTLSYLTLNAPFAYDSNGDGQAENYYFSLVGFVPFGSSTPTTVFSTVEGQANNANLNGVITEVPISTPEPLTLVLLGSALVGLVGLRRKF